MLARLPLAYTTFERAGGGPPRPVMYANHARDAKAACTQRPEALLVGLQKLWGRFFSPENLTLQDAVAVVHRPREGSIYRPWGHLRMEVDELHTGPPPSTAELAGTPKPFAPEALHIKFNCNNSNWLDLGHVRPETNNLERNFWNRVSEGSAKATWDRHCSVEISFNKFCKCEKIAPVFPLSSEIVQKYASWCDLERKH